MNEKLDNVVTWGCNRIFNDVKLTIWLRRLSCATLIYSLDMHMKINVGLQIGIFTTIFRWISHM